MEDLVLGQLYSVTFVTKNNVNMILHFQLFSYTP